jgi:hypothetical protein
LAVILVLLVFAVMLERAADRSKPTLPQTQSTPSNGIGDPNTTADPSGTEYRDLPTAETSDLQNNIQLPFALQEGLVITDIGKYAGVFMEDGSDETVSNILMIQVENTTGKDLYLAQIKLEYGDKTAAFQVTNLPNGAKAILLEQQRMPYTAQLPQSATQRKTMFLFRFWKAIFVKSARCFRRDPWTVLFPIHPTFPQEAEKPPKVHWPKHAVRKPAHWHSWPTLQHGCCAGTGDLYWYTVRNGLLI